MRVCTIEGCGKVHLAKGYCDTHYRRDRRYGDPFNTGVPYSVRNWKRGPRATTQATRGHKVCGVCHQDLPVSAFHRRPEQPGYFSEGYISKCKVCLSVEGKAARKRQDPQVQWTRHLRLDYRMTPADYERILATQGGVCVICGGPPRGPGRLSRRLAVDHDHSCCPTRPTCGECIRGLICMTCNLMLGYARDDQGILVAAIEYLREHSCA